MEQVVCWVLVDVAVVVVVGGGAAVASEGGIAASQVKVI